jgi:hypothetical protein
MGDLSDGAQQFRDLARNLTLVGAGELHRELYQAVSDAARPVAGDIRRSLPDFMPNRYAETLDADLEIRVSQRTGADTAGVVLMGRGRTRARKVKRLEAGVLSHPLFGNREHWYNQTSHVSAGFFSRPAEAAAPQIREAILAAMSRIADKATGRL